MTKDFFIYKGTWIDKKNLCRSDKITASQSEDLLSNGGLAVRNTYNWDKKDRTCFWYVIKDEFGGIDELPAKVRNQVKKSLKMYDVRLVTRDEMMIVGYELYQKSRARFKRAGRILTIQEWERKIDEENSEFWIGYSRENGNPASFAVTVVFEDYADYSMLGINPEFPNNTYPMYGLIYEMNRYYLDQRRVNFVCDGARSISEHSNIQSFLESKFKFRKSYCDLQVFYKSWFGILVKLLFPFRSAIKHGKVASVLRQEAWARGLEK